MVPAIDPALRDPLWNLRRAAMPLLLRHARRSQAGDVRRGHRRRARSDCRSSSPASARSCSRARHRRRVLRPRQRRLPAHPAAPQPQGSRRRRPHAPHHRGQSPTWCSSTAARSAASTATAWPAASGTRRCSARRSTTPFARSSGRSIPHNVLNPGKVVDAPPMTDNLRYGPGYRPARAGDGLRLQQAGRLRPLGRDVQRQRRLPQAAGRHHVPVVPGDARREATARAAGPTSCGWPLAGEEPEARPMRSRWVHDVSTCA